MTNKGSASLENMNSEEPAGSRVSGLRLRLFVWEDAPLCYDCFHPTDRYIFTLEDLLTYMWWCVFIIIRDNNVWTKVSLWVILVYSTTEWKLNQPPAVCCETDQCLPALTFHFYSSDKMIKCSNSCETNSIKYFTTCTDSHIQYISVTNTVYLPVGPQSTPRPFFYSAKWTRNVSSSGSVFSLSVQWNPQSTTVSQLTGFCPCSLYCSRVLDDKMNPVYSHTARFIVSISARNSVLTQVIDDM